MLLDGNADFAQVVFTLHATSRFPRRHERRKEQPDEKADDGHNDEKFEHGERLMSAREMVIISHSAFLRRTHPTWQFSGRASTAGSTICHLLGRVGVITKELGIEQGQSKGMIN